MLLILSTFRTVFSLIQIIHSSVGLVKDSKCTQTLHRFQYELPPQKLRHTKFSFKVRFGSTSGSGTRKAHCIYHKMVTYKSRLYSITIKNSLSSMKQIIQSILISELALFCETPCQPMLPYTQKKNSLTSPHPYLLYKNPSSL